MASMQSTSLSLLLVILATLASSLRATATEYDYVYYLSPSGNDKANGQSPATAWLTLTHACEQLADGDTLKVGSGVYYTGAEAAATAHSGTLSKPIVITTYNGTPSFIGPEEGGCLQIRHAHWIVDGLEIFLYNSGIYVADPGEVVIKNCTFGYMYDPEGEVSCAGIYVCADSSQSVDNVLITGCSFNDIPVEGGDSGEGIYVNVSTARPCSNVDIIDNQFTACQNGIDVKPGVQDCHVSLNRVSSCEYGIIYGSNGILERNLVEGTYGTAAITLVWDYSLCRNNVIPNGDAFGIRIAPDVSYGGDGHKIYNNTIMGVDYGIQFKNDNGASCDSNLVKNNVAIATYYGLWWWPFGDTLSASNLIDTNCWGADGVVLPGNAVHDNPIYEDPWFAQSDWHLATGDSVCQDEGLSLNDVQDDYDGDPRYQGGAYDVGADEVAVGLSLDSSRLVSMQAASPRRASERLAGTRLYGAQPNPFNPATTISFDLAESGRVELTVLNIRGVVVRRLVDESLTSGPHQVVWEGRDNRGQAAGSGIYLIQLRAATETFQSKAILLK